MDERHDDSPQSDPPPSQPSHNTTHTPEKSLHGRSSSEQVRETPLQLRRSSLRDPTRDRFPNEPTSPRRESTFGPGSMAETPFAPMNPGEADRIFPIRSVISVDPNPTPMHRGPSGEGYPFGSSATPPAEGGFRRSGARRASDARSSSLGGQSDSSRTSKTGTPAPSGGDGISSHANREAQRGAPDRRLSVATSRGDPGEPVQMNIKSEDVDTISEGAGSPGGTSIRSKGTGIFSVGENLGGDSAGLLTARFKHVVTDGGHAIITGRDGDTLQRCEDEPIHIPGAVQSFGLLVALREEGGKFVVRVASENSKEIIGYTPQQLFSLGNFLDILTEEQADNLLDHLDFIRDEESDTAINGPEVFMITIRPPRRRTQKLWCAMHINDANKDLVICEFELEDDIVNPLVPQGEATPEPPEDTLGSDPTPEEFAESTINKSKPLRVLRSARKKKGEAAAMEVFNVLSQVQEQLANAPNLELFLRVLIGVIKELTGFHRVMVYQFDQTFNGRVVAELIDPRATKDLYKGLNFPASDIPKQARDLYKVNKVRLLYDRDQETARLVCRTMEDLETPLDLTYSYLRAMSPIHVKYLANMAVRASMSVSITAFNELWGLIACHSYGQKGMRVSFPIRKMCRLVGDTASRNIERLSYASRLQARKLINTVPTEANPGGYIVASSEDLLKLFNADCGALSIREETKILGKPEQTHEVLALLEYLRLRSFGSVMTTQDITMDFPDLRYPPGFRYVAGLLFVPLSSGGNDFIVFFRKGQLREVKWAGNPYEKFVKEGTEGYLEPRASFKTWTETTLGRCKDWTEEEIETAAVLCLVYGKFIDVWRQKESAIQNTQLTKLLLANSAHEVRTPLHQIVNFLEIALEGSLDQETREALSKSHSASKSLIYVINDLLDLTKAEAGQDLIRDEVFDLASTMKEATALFEGEAKRKNIGYDVEVFPGMPQQVIGDQRRVRQVVSNVIANAIQHTNEGSVKVEVWATQQSPEKVDVEFGIQDTGAGMSPSKLDALFRALEQVTTEEEESDQDSSEEIRAIARADNEQRILGLGLAVVARLLRLMNGQLRLKSEEGKGSRFIIQIPFSVYHKDLKNRRSLTEGFGGLFPTGTNSTASLPLSTPPAMEGEITLVDRSAQKRPGRNPLIRRESAESMRSMDSMRSAQSQGSQKSQKSDVDRLIDAIQEPHMRSKSPDEMKVPRIMRTGSTAQDSPVRYHSKSFSTKHPHEQPESSLSRHGEERVQDSRTPVKSIRLPDEEQTTSRQLHSRPPSKVLFDIPNDIRPGEEPLTAKALRILVAEDDPINSRIVKKRLEKMGHSVLMTVNGEECASRHGENCADFDVVLMDIQMPIVDGMTSTKMIRSFEKANPGMQLSRRAGPNGRIPIFAVSASLVERERQTYIDTGLDGWILKPIDFKRVPVLLDGIVDEEIRNRALYEPGQWERGGWFEGRKKDPFTDTTPSGQTPTLANQLPVTSPEPLSHDPIGYTEPTPKSKTI